MTVFGGAVTISVRFESSGRREFLRWLRRALGPACLGEGRVTLPEVVASLLLRRRATIAVAESRTGGLVAHRSQVKERAAGAALNLLRLKLRGWIR